MMEIPSRAKDPLWIECCELWDKLSVRERVLIVKSMRLVAQGKVVIRDNESPDTASTPEE